MKGRSQRGLPLDMQKALETLVMSGRAAETDAGPASPGRTRDYRSQTDFATLPGFEELRMQRSVANLLNLQNPFFRVHQARAGATTIIGNRTYANFSSYDYLGLNGHPDVAAAAKAAIETYGTSPSASRLVAGERPVHRQLETAIAHHYGQEDSVVFVSGHATNTSVIGALMGPKDLILHDRLAHNSVIMGAILSRAERRWFPHNDVNALADMLRALRHQFDRVLIVIEGLYSMDGDMPDLAAMVALKREFGAWLLVDDAHGLGVLGERGFGLFEQCDVDPLDVDIWMGTLSKTLAACGGYIAGCADLIDYLKCMSGGFVYSVGLPPAMAAAATAALAILRREPQRVARLRANGALFCALARERGLDFATSLGLAVIPIMCRDSLVAVALSQKLLERGVNVQPIIHPAVPENEARLRFFLTSEHTPEQIETTVVALAEEMQSVGDGTSMLRRAH